MIKEIFSGYMGIFRAVARVALLLALCLGVASLMVWPLWKLANADPSLYTVIFCVIAGALVLFLAVTRARRSCRKNPRLFFISLASILSLVLGLAAAILLVLAWQRVLAGVTLLAAIALYGFFAFGLAPSYRNSAP
jgi:hypothetical protein